MFTPIHRLNDFAQAQRHLECLLILSPSEQTMPTTVTIYGIIAITFNHREQTGIFLSLIVAGVVSSV